MFKVKWKWERERTHKNVHESQKEKEKDIIKNKNMKMGLKRAMQIEWDTNVYIKGDGRLVPLLLDLSQPEEVEAPDTSSVLVGAVRGAWTLGVEGDHAQDLVVVP